MFDFDDALTNPQLVSQLLARSAGDAALRLRLTQLGHRLLLLKRYDDAMAVYDVLLTSNSPPLDRSIFNNALWLVQADNTGRAPDPDRVLRYLEAALPHGPSNPDIHMNAACVFVEKGDVDSALDQLEKAVEGKARVAEFLPGKLFDGVRDHPRFKALEQEAQDNEASTPVPSAFDLARPVPSWARAFSAEDYAIFRALVLRLMRLAKVEIDILHLDHGVVVRPDGRKLGLQNLARQLVDVDRDEWQQTMARHFANVSADAKEVTFEEARPHLRLRLLPARLHTRQPEHYVVWPLTSDLHVALARDTPGNVVFVGAEETERWGTERDELYRCALEGLRTEEPPEREEITLEQGPSILAFSGGYYTASGVLLLDEQLAPQPNGHLIGVPDRHTLFVVGVESAGILGALGPLVALIHDAFEQNVGAITDQVYWRQRDGVLVRLACGVREDGQAWVAPPEEWNALVPALPPEPLNRSC